MEKKLQRIPHEGAIAGICAGLGEYFNIDKTWVRIVFILSVFFAGYGIGLLGPIVYVVLWIVLPVKAAFLSRDPFDVDYRAPGFQSREAPAYEAANATGRQTKKSKDRYVAGIILLMVGTFFLLHQLNVFYWHDFARFWPVAIIILGIALLVGAFNTNQRTAPLQHEDEYAATAPSEPDEKGAPQADNDTLNHRDHE
ncbi:PspC domain-containing protein [Parapedobacter lycopersici]|uniref:PspC domain-containing protein n=1 Tax=Parapedobacter lycopersici TaxID=1864939 RepID=UPI00214D5A54|nr:PspC domain-containing protein [Parapedobacter lycopersici]